MSNKLKELCNIVETLQCNLIDSDQEELSDGLDLVLDYLRQVRLSQNETSPFPDNFKGLSLEVLHTRLGQVEKRLQQIERSHEDNTW